MKYYFDRELEVLRKNYNANDDKSKQGELRRVAIFKEPESSSAGPTELTERQLLPPTEVSNIREDSGSNGKISKVIKFLRRFRKKQ